MSESYESYLYAVIFDQGSVKVGCSSDPEMRPGEHRRTGQKMGIQVVKVLVELVLGGAGSAEQKLIQLCSKESKVTFKKEWFKYQDAETALRQVEGHFKQAVNAPQDEMTRKERRPSQAMTQARQYLEANPEAGVKELCALFGLHQITIYRSDWWKGRSATENIKAGEMPASTNQNKDTP